MVVLIIGILITIAMPIYVHASDQASTKSCQANQRTIEGCVLMYESFGGSMESHTEGLLAQSGSDWYEVLVPTWLDSAPSCPTSKTGYYVSTIGTVTGDLGVSDTFNPGHGLR